MEFGKKIDTQKKLDILKITHLNSVVSSWMFENKAKYISYVTWNYILHHTFTRSLSGSSSEVPDILFPATLQIKNAV